MEAVLTGQRARRARRVPRGCARSWRNRAFRRFMRGNCWWRSGRMRPRPAIANWAELMDYCRYSAAPVGRYVLELHGESTRNLAGLRCAMREPAGAEPSAGLRGRSAHAGPLLSAAGLAGARPGPRSTIWRGPRPCRRCARCSTKCWRRPVELNAAAAALPGLVKARRLRVETAMIAALARRLTALLQGGDPLATRVKLTKDGFPDGAAFCPWAGFA